MVSSALFEAFFVVLGVALALAANEWRQVRANQAHAVGALIYEQIFREGLASVAAAGKNLGAIISTFLYRETQLLTEYDELLATLDGGS